MLKNYAKAAIGRNSGSSNFCPKNRGAETKQKISIRQFLDFFSVIFFSLNCFFYRMLLGELLAQLSGRQEFGIRESVTSMAWRFGKMPKTFDFSYGDLMCIWIPLKGDSPRPRGHKAKGQGHSKAPSNRPS